MGLNLAKFSPIKVTVYNESFVNRICSRVICVCYHDDVLGEGGSGRHVLRAEACVD
jgi:hypothetical protein